MTSIAAVMPRLRHLRYGFLVVPGLTAMGFLGFAFLMVAIDRSSGADGIGVGVADDPEAARAILTTIAASLITVAGVSFSITMVTLQLVSQQFSPRVLRGFLGDRVNQTVAGVFVGVFIYCLLVMRTVSSAGAGEDAFVPALSVTTAIVLAVIALLLLLVFIDHIARNIQVSNVAANIARATLSTLRSPLYPEPYGRGVDDDPDLLVRRWHRDAAPLLVRSDHGGYVQSITIDDIARRVGSPGLRIHIRVAPGDFVTEGGVVAAYWPGESDGDVARAMRLAVIVAEERDMKQDLGYGIRQLADIATRAISPGINDPTTAWTCIRHLQSVMEHVVRTPPPKLVRRYDDADVTVAASRTPFATYVETAYVQIGRYATDARIAGALIENIAEVMGVADEAGATEEMDVLAATAVRVGRAACGDTDPTDVANIEDLLADVRRRAEGRTPVEDTAAPQQG